MKKRRTLIISLLLVAALALGVGYAALSSTLQVNGNIENDPANVNVVFSSSTLAASSPTESRITDIERVSSAGTTGTAVISLQAAGLKEVGDSVTFTLTIENKGNLTVTVEELIPTEEFICDYYTLDIASWADDVQLAPGGTTTATVVVAVKTLTDTQEIHDFSLKAVATPLNDGQTEAAQN